MEDSNRRLPLQPTTRAIKLRTTATVVSLCYELEIAIWLSTQAGTGTWIKSSVSLFGLLFILKVYLLTSPFQANDMGSILALDIRVSVASSGNVLVGWYMDGMATTTMIMII